MKGLLAKPAHLELIFYAFDQFSNVLCDSFWSNYKKSSSIIDTCPLNYKYFSKKTFSLLVVFFLNHGEFQIESNILTFITSAFFFFICSLILFCKNLSFPFGLDFNMPIFCVYFTNNQLTYFQCTLFCRHIASQK